MRNTNQEYLWPRWLRVGQAAKYASLCPKTIKNMILKGELRGDRTPGGHWRVDRDSIDEYFSRTDQKAVAVVESLGV